MIEAINNTALGQFSVLFSVILIVQSVAAIYILIRISSVAGEFQEAFMNYGYRWEDKKFVDDIQRKVRSSKIYAFSFGSSRAAVDRKTFVHLISNVWINLVCRYIRKLDQYYDAENHLLQWYCCGIYFSDDYETILNIAIPGSCCFKIGGTCSKWEISIFRPGCAFRLSAHGLFYSIYALSVFTLVFSVAEVNNAKRLYQVKKLDWIYDKSRQEEK